MKCDRPTGMTNNFGKFLAFEMSSGITDRRVAGVAVWPLIRASVFTSYLLPKLVGVGAAHPDFRMGNEHRKASGGALVRLRALRERLFHSPSGAFRSRDVLFALTPRQMRLPDGREVAQMLDFFITKLGCSSAVLESRKPGDAYLPRPNWPRVFHLDGYEGRFMAFVRSRRDVKESAREFAEKVVVELSAIFGIVLDVDKVAHLTAKVVCLQLFYGPLFRKWLRRLGIKCVVTVVHYAPVNQILCCSAHAEGIPVVELQHGTIYSAHSAYNLPQRNERYAPDYLFAWGEHWAGQTRNFALKRTLCTGYPALEYLLANNPPRIKEGARKILFISQGTIGAELSRRAVELRAQLPGTRYEIVYKLHPNETKTWRGLYPWLVDSEVKVVSNSETSVYELFRDASAVVGVYSTAVIEALMWQVKGFVFKDLPGGDTMTPFFRSGILEGICSVQELVRCLETDGADAKWQIDGSCFWSPNAAENIVAALRRIVEKGEL